MTIEIGMDKMVVTFINLPTYIEDVTIFDNLQD